MTEVGEVRSGFDVGTSGVLVSAHALVGGLAASPTVNERVTNTSGNAATGNTPDSGKQTDRVQGAGQRDPLLLDPSVSGVLVIQQPQVHGSLVMA